MRDSPAHSLPREGMKNGASVLSKQIRASE